MTAALSDAVLLLGGVLIVIFSVLAMFVVIAGDEMGGCDRVVGLRNKVQDDGGTWLWLVFVLLSSS
jgi:hypothetical protein